MDDVGVVRGEDVILQFLLAVGVCGVHEHEVEVKGFICGKGWFEFGFAFGCLLVALKSELKYIFHIGI